MHSTRPFRIVAGPYSSGFTLVGAVASLSVLAAIAAIGVPIVARQLHARAQVTAQSVRRIESGRWRPTSATSRPRRIPPRGIRRFRLRLFPAAAAPIPWAVTPVSPVSLGLAPPRLLLSLVAASAPNGLRGWEGRCSSGVPSAGRPWSVAAAAPSLMAAFKPSWRQPGDAGRLHRRPRRRRRHKWRKRDRWPRGGRPPQK